MRVIPYSAALGLALALAGCLVTKPAAADVSGWMFVGSGAAVLRDEATSATLEPTLAVDIGMGAPPSRKIVIGALARVQPFFGQGVDLGLVVRAATRGFVQGDWGGAVDLGGYQRWWGIGSTGGLATLQVGAPLGFTFGLSAAVGSSDAQTYSAFAGIDFARLTIYRRAGTNWWRNAYPSPRPTDR